MGKGPSGTPPPDKPPTWHPIPDEPTPPTPRCPRAVDLDVLDGARPGRGILTVGDDDGLAVVDEDGVVAVIDSDDPKYRTVRRCVADGYIYDTTVTVTDGDGRAHATRTA